MKLEILIIKDDSEVIHKSVSTVYEDSNPYNVAIQAIVEHLTGIKPISKVQAGTIPLDKPSPKFTPGYTPNNIDRFSQAVPDYNLHSTVPNYVPLIREASVPTSVDTTQDAPAQFHPDLVKAGIAKAGTPAIPTSKGIPVINLDMKTIFKDKK